MFLGPPTVALAVAFAYHPEFWDAAGASLAYFMISYWVAIIPVSVIAARRPPPPRPPRLRTRLALAIAGLAVMYLFFWWGGLGAGAALVIMAALPRADWIAPRS